MKHVNMFKNYDLIYTHVSSIFRPVLPTKKFYFEIMYLNRMKILSPRVPLLKYLNCNNV